MLFIGRLITGVAAGLAAGTAITYLIELRLEPIPKHRWFGPVTSYAITVGGSASARSSAAASPNGRDGRSPCRT